MDISIGRQSGKSKDDENKIITIKSKNEKGEEETQTLNINELSDEYQDEVYNNIKNLPADKLECIKKYIKKIDAKDEVRIKQK